VRLEPGNSPRADQRAPGSNQSLPPAPAAARSDTRPDNQREHRGPATKQPEARTPDSRDHTDHVARITRESSNGPPSRPSAGFSAAPVSSPGTANTPSGDRRAENKKDNHNK
jgi:hypothetical protein